MEEMKLKARAKINLSLDVLGRRDNGYHDVRMVMQSISLYDEIILKKRTEPGIVLESNFRYIPTNETNLAYRAAQILMDEFQIPGGLYIYLNKRIPAAAGLAGGSSDAATVLFGMNTMYELGLSREELMDRGLQIGADVPFCIMRGTVLAEGIGEELTRLPAAPHFYVLLIKPSFGVSTKKVYETLDENENLTHPDVDAMLAHIRKSAAAMPRAQRVLTAEDCEVLPGLLGNILEQVTVQLHPVIEDIRQDILGTGALGARMSGSGPTVFGLYATKEECKEAYTALKEKEYVGQIFYTEFYDPALEAIQRSRR